MDRNPVARLMQPERDPAPNALGRTRHQHCSLLFHEPETLETRPPGLHEPPLRPDPPPPPPARRTLPSNSPTTRKTRCSSLVTPTPLQSPADSSAATQSPPPSS